MLCPMSKPPATIAVFLYGHRRQLIARQYVPVTIAPDGSIDLRIPDAWNGVPVHGFRIGSMLETFHVLDRGGEDPRVEPVEERVEDADEH